MATLAKRPPAALRQWLARTRWQGVRIARLVGAQTLIALAMLLIALILLWHGRQMQQQRVQIESQWQAQQAQRKAQSTKPQIDPASADVARQLSQFYAFLPSHDALPDQIKRLLASAEKHGLQLAQADYKAMPQANTTMLRYQIVLPVKADYPKIVSFLQSAMQEMPSLSLESLQIKRSSIDAAEVEARLQLVLFVQNKRAKSSKGGQHE